MTPFHQRVEMLQLAIAGQPAFRVDELEMERPGVSYTADTLATLKQRHPDADFHFIIDSDWLPDLTHFRQPERIVVRIGLMIVNREGWPVWPTGQLCSALRLPPQVLVHQEVVEMPTVAISSSDLRQRAANGNSVRYLVPRAVECYMQTHRLSQDGSAKSSRRIFSARLTMIQV